MEMLLGIVVLVLAVLALVGSDCFSEIDEENYDEYRRAEFRNEYPYESKQKRSDYYILNAMTLRRP